MNRKGMSLFADNMIIYPSFEHNFYYIIKLFCLEVLDLNGEGVLTQPFDAMMDYFVTKYCAADKVISIDNDNITLKINKQIFKFSEFASGIGTYTHNLSYDNRYYVDLMLPFTGNSELLFVKPVNYKTRIKFSVVTIQPPQFISVQNRYDTIDENIINSTCLNDINTINELVMHINDEYLQMNKQFTNGIYRLASHPTKKFSSKRVVLDYCYSYLVFNQDLNRIFGMTS